MKRSYVMTGLGIVAAVGLISTAIAASGGSTGKGAGAEAAAKKVKRGPRGAPGPAGPQGTQGLQGVAGPPATQLLACRALDGTPCTASEGANVGVTGVAHTGGTNTYVVTFNKSVVGCNAHAQLNLPGSTTTGTANPTSNDIAVLTFDAAGAGVERAFRLAVFC